MDLESKQIFAIHQPLSIWFVIFMTYNRIPYGVGITSSKSLGADVPTLWVIQWNNAGECLTQDLAWEMLIKENG